MKKILVTGASSFLGQHLIPKLEKAVYPHAGSSPRFEILTPTSKELNLLDRKSVVEYLAINRPDTILHMAARCGGIGANKDNPALFIHDNLKMSVNLFDAIKTVNKWDESSTKNHRSRRVVSHFYGLGSVCSYPKHCPVPFKETDLWNGMPEETNFPYGEAKRVMLLMQQSFRQQFGLKGAHLIPVNLYGPHDHFDLRNSHVIPALIRKFLEAKRAGSSRAEVWGDGTPTREFLYAGDCADAIIKAVTSSLDYEDPINLGTGIDISIKGLASLISKAVGFNGELVFTGEVSVNGQPKRRLDVSRAKEVLDFQAQTPLYTGLVKTVKWYEESTKNYKVEMRSLRVKESIQKSLKEGFPNIEVGDMKVEESSGVANITFSYREKVESLPVGVATPYDVLSDTPVMVKAINNGLKVPPKSVFRPVDGRAVEESAYNDAFKDLREAGEKSPEDFMKAVQRVKELAPKSQGNEQLDNLTRHISGVTEDQAESNFHAELEHERFKKSFDDLRKGSSFWSGKMGDDDEEAITLDEAKELGLLDDMPTMPKGDSEKLTIGEKLSEIRHTATAEVEATQDWVGSDVEQFRKDLNKAAQRINDADKPTAEEIKKSEDDHWERIKFAGDHIECKIPKVKVAEDYIKDTKEKMDGPADSIPKGYVSEALDRAGESHLKRTKPHFAYAGNARKDHFTDSEVKNIASIPSKGEGTDYVTSGLSRPGGQRIIKTRDEITATWKEAEEKFKNKFGTTTNARTWRAAPFISGPGVSEVEIMADGFLPQLKDHGACISEQSAGTIRPEVNNAMFDLYKSTFKSNGGTKVENSKNLSIISRVGKFVSTVRSAAKELIG